MKCTSTLTILLLATNLIGVAASTNTTSATQNVRVVIGFDDTESLASFYQASTSATDLTLSRVKSFSRAIAMAVSIPSDQYDTLEALATLHNCSDIHLDDKKYLMAETTPYGIELVQGNDERIPLPTSGNTLDDDCFKVCLIDSGLAVGHPDIPFSVDSSNILGQVFDLEDGETWYSPSTASYHGTHVAGTIFAEGGNDIGVVGVIPETQGVCLLVARVFDESGSSDSSTVLESVEWCADQGAKVINLSLGRSGGGQVREERAIYSSVASEGILVVAAAGNDGTRDYSYPASYPFVLSVAAVDDDMDRASFSNYNDMVDISAPGVDVLSTTISAGIEISMSSGDTVSAELMAGSPDLSDFNTDWTDLEVVDCGLAFDTCDDATGKVCLIERGEIEFTDKAFNCFQGGGVAAVIYNTENEVLYGLVDSSTPIPTLSLTRQDGTTVLDAVNSGSTASLEQASYGYAYESGTSMATPHVTGVIAKVWAALPDCSRDQVEEALLASAIELGDSDEYGSGLVQAYGTYQYLLSNFAPPCGNVGVETGTPTSSPVDQGTTFPSSYPSFAPSPQPSRTPYSTDPPTNVPTHGPTFSTDAPTELPTPDVGSTSDSDFDDDASSTVRGSVNENDDTAAASSNTLSTSIASLVLTLASLLLSLQ